MGADLLAFLPPAIVLVLVPGADTAICIKNVAGVSRARRLEAGPAFRRWIDRVFGSVLVALGLRLALERR